MRLISDQRLLPRTTTLKFAVCTNVHRRKAVTRKQSGERDNRYNLNAGCPLMFSLRLRSKDIHDLRSLIVDRHSYAKGAPRIEIECGIRDQINDVVSRFAEVNENAR